MERIPYMSPGLVGPEKTARGKTSTNTWWHTITEWYGKNRLPHPETLWHTKENYLGFFTENGLVFDFFHGSDGAKIC